MKHLVVLILGLALMVGTAVADISGSPHDLSSVTGASNEYHSTNQDQICIFCHTPHFASTTQTPLWNRNDPTTTYTTYYSPTIDAYTTAPEISGTSVMCLSCHDGVTALNSLLYYGTAGQPAMVGDSTLAASTANLAEGTALLTNDHPVSFSYDDAVTGAGSGNPDDELQPTATVEAYGWALDPDGKVQCSSCHDVHDYGDTSDMQPFLNWTKTGSELCLKCHIK